MNSCGLRDCQFTCCRSRQTEADQDGPSSSHAQTDEHRVYRFHALHEQLYRFRLDAACEIVNLRAVALGKGATLTLTEADQDGPSSSHAQTDEHRVYFDSDFLTTPIYDRAKLRPGNQLAGPAIVTEMDSTSVVLPNFVAEIDRYANILIRPNQAKS